MIICERHGFFPEHTCPVCALEYRKEKMKNVNIVTWKPRFFRDLDVKPIYITSKKQLKEECKKRNLKAACLM